MNEVVHADLSQPTFSGNSPKRRKKDLDGKARPPHDSEQSRFCVNVPTSGEVTQLVASQQLGSTDRYSSYASIILVGMSGSGKTTLAVIASLSLGWKYVDLASFYVKQTGHSPADHINQHGIYSYRESETSVAKVLFQQCAHGHIIEVLSDFTCRAQSALLKDVARKNPVIYVRRDQQELRSYLTVEENKFKHWHEYSDKVYSLCSSFEFYNLSADIGNSRGQDSTSTLRLKETETDFIRFLHRLLGQRQRLLHSNDALSPTYTYALTAPLSWLEKHQDHEELECGVDAISFIIDVPHDSPDLQSRVAKQMAYLRRFSRLPIVLEAHHSVPNRISACSTILKLGMKCLPDMVALDLSGDEGQLRSASRSRCDIKVIGTLHREAPWQASQGKDEFWEAYNRAKNTSCSALRITFDAVSRSDNLQCIAYTQEVIQDCDLAVSIYNTGKLGYTSICFNSVLSPTVSSSSLALDGLTVQQAQSALHSCFALTKKSFYIFGKSVSYSLSPAMHNAAYTAVGMPHRYSYTESDEFSDINKLFEEETCAGVAVSLPFKTRVLELLDHVSLEARDIGAVNTITVEKPEASSNTIQRPILKGHNTDHIGLKECIYQNLSPANVIRNNTSALILGAGGMARAAIYACRTLGVKQFCIFNRTMENAEELARNSTQPLTNIHVLRDLDDEWPTELSQPTIIISTNPAHSIGDVPPHELDIPPRWLQSRTGGVFVELAYKPLVTRFLRQMRLMSSRGWITVDGLDVLVAQGIAQFEIFTGRPAPIHVMRHAVRKQYQEINDREPNT